MHLNGLLRSGGQGDHTSWSICTSTMLIDPTIIGGQMMADETGTLYEVTAADRSTPCGNGGCVPADWNGFAFLEKDASGGSGLSHRQDAHGRAAVGLGIVLGVLSTGQVIPATIPKCFLMTWMR
jgi:hypothetical protein